MIDLPLRAMRYFVAVADVGNVTLAAKSLNVSQPSVSLAIAQLESAFGVQLFIRQHGRGVALTPAGADALREVRKLCLQLTDFSATMADVGATLRGTLSIGCLSYLVSPYLPRIIRGFAKQYPEIEIVFSEGDQEELERGLMAGRIEAVLTYDLLLPRSCAVEVLLALPPYLLLPAKHRLANHKMVSLKEIAIEPCVLLDLPISRDYVATIFGTFGLTPNIRYRTYSIESVRSFVASGLGYSIMNQPPKAQDSYYKKGTKAVPLKERLPPVRIGAAYLAGHKPRLIAQTFLDYAREFFRREAGENLKFDAQYSRQSFNLSR